MSSNFLLKQKFDGANQTHLRNLWHTIDFVMFEMWAMFGEETQTNLWMILGSLVRFFMAACTSLARRRSCTKRWTEARRCLTLTWGWIHKQDTHRILWEFILGNWKGDQIQEKQWGLRNFPGTMGPALHPCRDAWGRSWEFDHPV